MNMRGRKFEVDKANGKVAGVCAGIANALGVDVTVVRVGFVLATVLGGFPWTLIGYGVLAIVGQPKAGFAYNRASARGRDDGESRERMRSLDLRMQAIETYVTSANSSLAREIEELR
jgi:phage shock protein C